MNCYLSMMARWSRRHFTAATALGPQEVELEHSKVVVSWLLQFHVFRNAPHSTQYGGVSHKSPRTEGPVSTHCSGQDRFFFSRTSRFLGRQLGYISPRASVMLVHNKRHLTRFEEV